MRRVQKATKAKSVSERCGPRKNHAKAEDIPGLPGIPTGRGNTAGERIRGDLAQQFDNASLLAVLVYRCRKDLRIASGVAGVTDVVFPPSVENAAFFEVAQMLFNFFVDWRL